MRRINTLEEAQDSQAQQQESEKDLILRIFYWIYVKACKDHFDKWKQKKPNFKPFNRLSPIEKNQLTKVRLHLKNLDASPREYFDVIIADSYHRFQMYPAISSLTGKVAAAAWKNHSIYHAVKGEADKVEKFDLSKLVRQYELGDISKAKFTEILEANGYSPESFQK